MSVRFRSSVFAAVVGVLSLAVTAGGATVKSFPAFGVTITPPMGWNEQTPDMLDEVMGWTHTPKPGSPDQAITLRCEPAAKGDLAANAVALAIKYQGAVLDEKATLDGEPAKVIWVSREGVNVELRAVVAIHAGLIYIVESTGPVGGLPRAETDQFIKDLRFVALDAISDHIREEGPRMTILSGKLTVTRPDIMRPAAPLAMQTGDRFIFMTPRSKGTDAEFICVVGIVSSPKPFGDLATTYLNSLKPQDPDGKLQWQNNDAQRRLSNLVPLKKTDPAGAIHTINTIVGIAKLDGVDPYVVVNFQINTDNGDKRAAYETAAKKIFDSIKPAGK